MAIIGFIVLVIVGLYFIVIAIGAAFVSAGFSGKVEVVPVVFFGAIGGLLLYAAWQHAPFTIALTTS